MRKLLVIYSRSIKKLKLKYFLRYYNNVILSDYIKYQKLNNMFKRKTQKFYNHSKNDNYIFDSNYDEINIYVYEVFKFNELYYSYSKNT